jgi:GxxExxY protein
MNINDRTEQIIGAATEVHKAVGPGLLESAYEECLSHELHSRGIPFVRQHSLPLRYKEVRLECGYRVDLVVDNMIVVELKTVERIEAIHAAQLLTYLRLGNWPVGLIINFNSVVLKNGIKRVVNGLVEASASSAPPR